MKSADTLDLSAVPAGYELAPRGYLCVVAALARSPRRGEYAVFHFGSGSFFRTDRLGAMATRALIDGRPGSEAMDLVEGIDAGAGERARRLICLLGSTGGMNVVKPRRRRSRRLAALSTGMVLSAIAPLVRVAPTRLLAWMFKMWPSSPIARHAWRSSRATVINNLEASGYADRNQAWLRDVGSRCVAEASRNYLFNFVGIANSGPRLDRLVERLFDRQSLDELAHRLRSAGPVIGVYLHGPLQVAVPNALRTRGLDTIRVVVPITHGINVEGSSGRLGDFFGDSSGAAVEESDPNASGALLRHLKAGRNLHLALDKLAGDAAKGAKVEMLGHCLPRNDGPAWLAVQSGRPAALWTTHNSRAGVVITPTPLLYPDPALPVKLRVADLSQRLYTYAESAIREHPEAWTCWTYPNLRGGELL